MNQNEFNSLIDSLVDRAMQAMSQTKMASIELNEIIDHIKQS